MTFHTPVPPQCTTGMKYAFGVSIILLRGIGAEPGFTGETALARLNPPCQAATCVLLCRSGTPSTLANQRPAGREGQGAAGPRQHPPAGRARLAAQAAPGAARLADASNMP